MKYFSLGSVENSRLVRIIQIIFGVICFAVAIFWLIFNIKSLRADGTLWITIIFLTGFGSYQIFSGLGFTTRFIEIHSDKIRLKKNGVLPVVEILGKDIQKIELYPFNLFFYLKTNKRILLRFGATYVDTNEKIKDEILIFSELNSINLELKEEKI